MRSVGCLSVPRPCYQTQQSHLHLKTHGQRCEVRAAAFRYQMTEAIGNTRTVGLAVYAVRAKRRSDYRNALFA